MLTDSSSHSKPDWIDLNGQSHAPVAQPPGQEPLIPTELEPGAGHFGEETTPYRDSNYNSLVYLSHYLTNLMHQICFTVSFISSLYMFRAHVLIIRRSKLHYTASGNGCKGCVMQFWPPDDEHMCSKHVEAWNKTYCETNFVHQVG